MILSGTEGLYGAVVAVFSVLAWLWVALAVLVAGVLVAVMYQARRSAWVREPEEIPFLERVTVPLEDPEPRAA